MPATQPIDFSARYAVDGYRGVAFYLKGYAKLDPDEEYEYGDELDDDRDRVIGVMVGDDRKHVIDVSDLTVLEDGSWCPECGQIGCCDFS